MAKGAQGAKADDVRILDLRKISSSFDFFVLCSASSDRRMRTIAQTIEESLAHKGKRPWHVEGAEQSGWMLLDFGGVIAHIFDPQMRLFYGLERLWADAPVLRVSKTSGA